ncbi:hypothetical protein ACEQUB_00347 [Ralstonia syzygii]
MHPQIGPLALQELFEQQEDAVNGCTCCVNQEVVFGKADDHAIVDEHAVLVG